MAVTIAVGGSRDATFRGLRMTAEAFLEIPDDGFNYELLDGVVMMSPSPKPVHQRVAVRIAFELGKFLEDHPVGEVLTEIDIHLGVGPGGGDVVYKPELIFVRAERLPQMQECIVGGPDVVVEVVSRGSRRMDRETKKQDYERAGVLEYWLIDPELESMTFWRLKGGRFEEVAPVNEAFASEAVPAFVLDLARVRETFESW